MQTLSRRFHYLADGHGGLVEVDPFASLSQKHCIIGKLSLSNITWALSGQQRYFAHRTTDCNVSLHSCFLYDVLTKAVPVEDKKRAAQWALLHDVSEIFMGDAPAPIRAIWDQNDQYAKHDYEWNQAVFALHDLESLLHPPTLWKNIDKAICAYEFDPVDMTPFQKYDFQDIDRDTASLVDSIVKQHKVTSLVPTSPLNLRTWRSVCQGQYWRRYLAAMHGRPQWRLFDGPLNILTGDKIDAAPQVL